MPRCGRVQCRSALLAVSVTLCLLVSLRLISEERDGGRRGGRLTPLSDDTPVTQTVRTDRCSVLSIVCLAGSAQPAGEPDLAALGSTHQHVVLAGHSRLRQVFEQLQPLLGAPLRTRADRPPPLADTDDPRVAPLPDNSTCLAPLRKPRGRPTIMWCSRAADRGRLLLDFRWRHQTAPLSELLERLAARPPDRLVIAHGQHQDGPMSSLMRLRDELQPLLPRLRRLRRLGTAAVWMLEAGKNPYTEMELPVQGHSMVVLNALTSEAALEAGVPLWSAHLPLVQDWLLRECRRPETADAESREVCEREQMHADPGTNRRMARQLAAALLAEQ